MPAKFDLSWDKTRSRWAKMVDGKRLAVSPRTLKKLGYLAADAPETKEGSRAAANQWLAAQLQAESPPPTLLEKKLSWAAENDPSQVSKIKEQDPNELDPRARETLDSITALGGFDHLEASHLNKLFGEAAIWRDRFSRQGRSHASAEKKVAYWQAVFLQNRKAEVVAKQLSPAQWQEVKACLEDFLEFLGTETLVDKLNASTWDRWFHHLLSSDKGYWWKRKRVSNVRNFINFLTEQDLVQSFAALTARRYKFQKTKVQPDTPNSVIIKGILDQAKGSLKCYLHLMANCGFTQIDLGRLQRNQYDPEARTITRQRTKTSHHNTRTVRYKLWPETVAMIEECKSDAGAITEELAHKYGDPLFLTRFGNPLTQDGVDEDGKRGRTDAVTNLWRNLDPKPEITLRQFRQASGDKIYHKFGSKELADMFLGHGQDDVDASYFSDPQARLDDAIDWLRFEYLRSE